MSKINKKDIVKEKIKKVSFWSLNIVCYISTFLFILFIIIGSVGVKKQSSNTHKYKNEVVEVIDSPSRAIGVDDDYINLYPSDENISYNFDFIDEPVLESSQFELHSSDYSTFVAIPFSNYVDTDYIVFGNSTDNIYINLYQHTFSVYQIVNESSIPYIYDYISIVLDSSQEQDTLFHIVYDAWVEVQYSNPNDDIFDNIGDSVVGFVGTINSGLTSAISIFYNDGLTTIGILSIIVVSVVLAYFALRMIIGLIRLRG